VTDGVLFCEDKSAICVTCSDDCSVIVSHFSYTNRELHLLERRSLHGHRSSVKCITSVQNQGFSGSIVFTAGGRAQICAWFVGLSGNYYMILYTALCWRWSNGSVYRAFVLRSWFASQFMWHFLTFHPCQIQFVTVNKWDRPTEQPYNNLAAFIKAYHEYPGNNPLAKWCYQWKMEQSCLIFWAPIKFFLVYAIFFTQPLPSSPEFIALEILLTSL